MSLYADDTILYNCTLTLERAIAQLGFGFNTVVCVVLWEFSEDFHC